jgi:adenosylcobinamide-GDP ribazoletransferase
MIARSDLFNALRFLTILPVPDSAEPPAPDWLIRSMVFFPAVGAGIGLLAAMVLVVGGDLFGHDIAALLAVTAAIIVTGALHEDGLADTVDAFGGGWSVEKRLEIMKDSRIGTYGAVALGLGVALRVAALIALPLWAGASALIAGHAIARAFPAFVTRKMSYAGNVATMKVQASYSESPLRPEEIRFILIGAATAALPLFLVSIPALAIGLLLGLALATALARWAKRLIGGYTGDVLGATTQLFEIGFLLGVVMVLRG